MTKCSSDVSKIKSLPDEVVHLLLTAPEKALKSSFSSDEVELLIAARLFDEGGRPFPLCRSLAYHAGEFQRLADPSRKNRIISELRFEPSSRVLDVGCGAGQALFSIKDQVDCDLFGVDSDEVAIEFAKRIAQFKGLPSISFTQAYGEALPFADNSMDRIMCRVALNYMHQNNALMEMARVLERNGRIWLQVENIGMDLRLMANALSWREVASRLVDLCIGCAAATILSRTGTKSGRRFTGRLLCSNRLIRRELVNLGCSVEKVEVMSRYFGVKQSSFLTALKR